MRRALLSSEEPPSRSWMSLSAPSTTLSVSSNRRSRRQELFTVEVSSDVTVVVDVVWGCLCTLCGKRCYDCLLLVSSVSVPLALMLRNDIHCYVCHTQSMTSCYRHSSLGLADLDSAKGVSFVDHTSVKHTYTPSLRTPTHTYTHTHTHTYIHTLTHSHRCLRDVDGQCSPRAVCPHSWQRVDGDRVICSSSATAAYHYC